MIALFKKIFSFPGKLRSIKMRSGLLVILIVHLAVFMILPIIYTILSSLCINEREMITFRREAEFIINEAELFAKKDNDFSTFNMASQIDPNNILIIINTNGNTVYESRPLPDDFKLPVKNARTDSEFVRTDNGTALYRKIRSDLTAYCYLENENNLAATIIIITLGFIVLFLATIFFFKKTIYNPIVLMENVLNGVVDGNTDFNLHNLNKPEPLHSIFSDLDKLLSNMKQLMLRESNAQLLKKQAELDALQSQINPHFLYNTLDCIRGQALRYGLHDIELMALSLSKLFRYSISNNNTLVSLEEELSNIENYLAVQQLRFNNKFIVQYYIADDTLDCKIPKLIIQPIIENAIYHGLETKIGRGVLTIRTYKTERRLIINIQDDGRGIPQTRLEEINSCLMQNIPIENLETHKFSVGLMNVNSRIKLSFGDQYGLNIYSTLDIGTDVQFNLPLIVDTRG